MDEREGKNMEETNSETFNYNSVFGNTDFTVNLSVNLIHCSEWNSLSLKQQAGLTNISYF